MEQEPFQIPEIPQTPAGKNPRTFGEIPALWLRFFRMPEDFFAAEAPRASDSNTLLSLAVMVGISIVTAIIMAVINSGSRAMLMPDYGEFAAIDLGGSIIGGICGGICGGLFGTILGFYISNGLIYLCAQIFGGRGSFSTQTYLASLFLVPASVISQLGSIVFSLIMLLFGQSLIGITVVGLVALLFALIFSVYTIILYTRALKVTHGLSTGMAAVATILPTVIIIGIIGCLIMGGLVLLAPTLSEVFDEIMWELQQF